MVAWERELVQVGLVVDEQVELRGFQALEEAEGVLEEEEAKEEHFDPEPGRQLEDVQADWDTEKKRKKSDSMRNTCILTTYHGKRSRSLSLSKPYILSWWNQSNLRYRRRSQRKGMLTQSLVGSLKMWR